MISQTAHRATQRLVHASRAAAVAPMMTETIDTVAVRAPLPKQQHPKIGSHGPPGGGALLQPLCKTLCFEDHVFRYAKINRD